MPRLSSNNRNCSLGRITSTLSGLFEKIPVWQRRNILSSLHTLQRTSRTWLSSCNTSVRFSISVVSSGLSFRCDDIMEVQFIFCFCLLNNVPDGPLFQTHPWAEAGQRTQWYLPFRSIGAKKRERTPRLRCKEPSGISQEEINKAADHRFLRQPRWTDPFKCKASKTFILKQI